MSTPEQIKPLTSINQVRDLLNDEQGDMWILTYVGGQSDGEIAEIMDVTVKHVRVTLRRACKRLKECGFNPYDGDSIHFPFTSYKGLLSVVKKPIDIEELAAK